MASDWSGWDWRLSVAVHAREACVVLRGLLALLGMMGGARPGTVSRRRRAEVFAVLRPLEAALRRIVVMAMKAAGAAVLSSRKATPPAGPIPRGDGASDRPLPFVLFDARNAPLPTVRRTVPEARAPRIAFFDGLDDRVAWPARPGSTGPAPEDALSADGLVRRLLSAKAALEDIPRQAKRMARAVARRAGRSCVPCATPARRDTGHGGGGPWTLCSPNAIGSPASRWRRRGHRPEFPLPTSGEPGAA